jgi:glycerol-3-phosphate dehydrogenase
VAHEPVTVFSRAVALERLASEHFDVLVIGGGVTGAGVLLDAASRGLSAALVERDDFASGTSSKSSKLVHGGLRYLQQREFALVHESLVERQRLLRNAAHLVEALEFVVPLFAKGAVIDRAVGRAYASALWMYDLAGGWRIGKRHRRLSADEIAAHLPTLRRDRLVGGFVYYDAWTDDARLTLTLARTAVLSHRAVALNHACLTEFVREPGGRVTGAVVADRIGGRSIEVRAASIVNATGIWADEVRLLDEGSHPNSIRPAKGIHLTVKSSRLPCDVAAVLPVRTDHRSIFVVPWGEHTYIGTTDTDYAGPLDDPRVEDGDVEYLLEAVNDVVSEPLTVADVTGRWAGLRPLLAAGRHHGPPSERTADLSRRHQVVVSDGGVVTITGGKLTTYRKMAEDAVDALAGPLGRRLAPSRTRRLALRGAEGGTSGSGRARDLGVSDATVAHLRRRYGTETDAVLGLAARRPELAEPLVAGLPYLKAEAIFAVDYEMAADLGDLLDRRTRARLLDAGATNEAANEVAALVADRLGWGRGECAMAVERYLAGAPVPGRAAG